MKQPLQPNDRQGNPPKGIVDRTPHVHSRDWKPPAFHPCKGPHAPYGMERMHEAAECVLKGRRCRDKD